MQDRWKDEEAKAAIDRWGDALGEAVALRLYTAKLIGCEPDLVLHGGGNVSVKCEVRTLLSEDVEAVRVKSSGAEMSRLTPSELPALHLPYLRRLRKLDRLTDDEMVNAFRTHLFDANAPTPSIETLLHAFLPHRFVDHSHADAILAMTNQPNGESLIGDVLGRRVAVLPYVRPGFELAKAAAEAIDKSPQVEGLVLLQHGLVTFADDARTSYQRHINLVSTCEEFLCQKQRDRTLTVSFRTVESPADLATRAAPILRGLLAAKTDNEDRPYLRPILEWRATDGIMAFVNSAEARNLAPAGAVTADHVIRTKTKPMFVEQPAWNDAAELRTQLEQAVERFRDDNLNEQSVDRAPRVVLLPGAGAFCWGPTKTAACIAADMAEHTIDIKTAAHFCGSYHGLSSDHLCDMEMREIQRRKLNDESDRPLAGQVVIVSGGAGAIGAAVADCCIAAGAHVALADIDESRLAGTVSRIEQQRGTGRAIGFAMDVTDEKSVHDGYEHVVRHYGGVDVVVPNAGVAHVSPIEALALEDFRTVMEVNAVGYFLFMREGIRVLESQGLGGNIIINASKNVFGPGKDFGAYSASKAAGHQLGKVAAIELAPKNIRVNMINADAVFGDPDTPSGLWATVGPSRAKSRNLEPEDLPDYYRRRNLLKTRIHGRHVGHAVVFFASNATPTTGATLPIDGGVVEAFPR